MKFSITNHGGQFQFWHMDCEDGMEKPMYKPISKADNIKEFTCVNCGKTGAVTLTIIQTGEGELKCVNNPIKDK